ncbi:MAG: glycosyltransferase [Nitrospirota bacterium]|nr:glycosyltransferase [Nitrospirota bacterium]
MNILFLTRSLNYGGCERQLVLLANGLWSRGVAVAAATFYPGGSLRKELESTGVSLESLEKRGRWDVLGFFLRLIFLVCRIQPTILHGYLATANILTVLLRPFCPSTKIVWGLRASNMELDRYGYVDQIQSWVECKLSHFADLIVVNSHAGFDFAARKGFPQDKMVVISNGIDVDRFCPNSASRQRMRQAWGISDREELIGLIGRLDPMKGHDTFIKAAALLSRGRENIRYICVGDGPEAFKQKLIALSKEMGLSHRLIWVSASDDVGAIYNALDLVTSCSSYGEGFSNVIGEAMACGRPCVVTDVGDAKRIVGDTGYVVTPGNPSALASAWQVALDAEGVEKARRSQRARERVIEHFSLEQLIQETARVLETTVKTGALQTK